MRHDVAKNETVQNRNLPLPARLGKNSGGYAGECIDIRAVLGRCRDAARRHGWREQAIPIPDGEPVLGLVRPAPELKRPLYVYVSAGIHGDEPAGPLAAEQLLEHTLWPDNLSFWMCPCLNPHGFLASTRENRQGVDLNRQYLNPTVAETQAHVAWMETQPRFDVCFCLHEDWEANGFYLYELNPRHRPSLARDILRAAGTVCPIDESPVIEGRPASEGLISPNIDPNSRPDWPEAFYLITHKTDLSYTLEAPSDFALEPRVNALVAATASGITAAIELRASNHFPER